MWGVTALIAVGAVLVAFEVPALIKQSSWRVLVAFFVLLTVGLSLLICISIGIKIPSPLELLRPIYEQTGKAIRRE
ncbi:hypothetical protein [Paenibacillus taichungensis]|uniref:hypothetical protein n=1 Tax=Paenibacillus taichungensis TaxID=484184 RepID=UPI0039A166C5